MNNQPEIQTIVQEKLDKLKAVPERTSQAANHARARFLAQAVSANEVQRHKGWKSIFRKEQFAMNILISVLVIAGLVVGGGTTVKAAQNDLPGEPLYAVKTFSENVSVQFQNDPSEKVDHLLELAQTRVEEMKRMVESGQNPPEQVRSRLEQHLQQALQLCSNMDDATLDQKLAQIHDQLQRQERDMQRLQDQAPQSAQPILEQTRTMLQIHLQLTDEGLLNHEAFRNTVRNGFRNGQTATPPATAPVTTSTPQQEQNHNREQNRQNTPQPGGQGNGEGPGPNADPGGLNSSVTPMPTKGANQPASGNSSSGGGSGSGKNGSGGSGSGGGGSDGNRP